MRIVAILAAMIVPLAVYFPVYQQREKAIERADKEIGELEKRIEQAQAAARKLPQFRDEVVKLDTELTKLRRILPPDPALNEIRELGKELIVDEVPEGGGTDAAFAALKTKAPVIERFGLRGYGAHSAEAEYVLLDSIEPRLYLLARMIMSLSHGKSS